jgi:hypothetical protein
MAAFPLTFPAALGGGDSPAPLDGEASAAATAADLHAATYQAAGRLTIAASALNVDRIDISGHRIPGSSLTVTIT